MSNKFRTIWVLSCGNGDQLPEREIDALRSCYDEVRMIADLCKACVEGGSGLWVPDTSPVTIACYRPRAVRALLEFCGRWPGEEKVTWVAPEAAAVQGGQSTPWYPVIDRTRCTDCGQCHAFCLFGAYRREKRGRVQVAEPLNCKQNCPACARICPSVAVIFPLLDEAPFNGEAVDDEASAEAAARVAQEQMMASDPYRMLKARRAAHKRRLVNREQLERALAERERCSGSHVGCDTEEEKPSC